VLAKVKKGQIEIQFNWIFIFIVGVIILIFFLFVIRSQTKSADIELAGDIIKNLDTVVKSAQTTVDAEKIIAMPNVKISFICEPDTNISFYDLGNGVKKDTPYDIIFSQEKLSGYELISWTQSWDVPFRIATFQYLTTKRAQFIIVNDTGTFAEELNKSLPKGMNKLFINPNDNIVDNNYDYYKIIEFDGSKHTGDKPTKNVHKIIIHINSGQSTIDSYGTVKFDEPDVPIINFVKKASLFGAIFSEDADFYNCTMNKAFDRFEILMKLQHNRTGEIKDKLPAEMASCRNIFIVSGSDMDSLSSKKLVDAANIFEGSKKIMRANENLIRGKNCPLIY